MKLNYGKAIRFLRALRDMSQKQLAMECRIDVSYVSLLESGRRIPSEDVVNRIVGGLGVSRFAFNVVAAPKEDLKAFGDPEALVLGKQILGMLT